jgi:hypothetical protein
MAKRVAMQEYSARLPGAMKERLVRAAALATKEEGSPVHVAVLLRRAVASWLDSFERDHGRFTP